MANFGIDNEYENAFARQVRELVIQAVESIPVNFQSARTQERIKQWKKKMLEGIK